MGVENEIIKGLYSNSDYMDRTRLYAQDQDFFKFFIMYQLYEVSILRVLSEKFGKIPTEQITDFELKYPEMEELPYEFSPQAQSTDDDTNKTSKIKLTNDDANALHEYHILAVKADGSTDSTSIYVNSDGSAMSTTLSSTTPLIETVMVIDIDKPNSAGLGYTYVTVQRSYPNDNPTATLLPIKTNHKLTIVNNIAAEDSLPFPPSTKNYDFGFNYVQTTRESYGISSHVQSGIKTFLDKDQLDINLEMASLRVLREIETAIIMGRRSKKKVSNNKMLYQVGGLNEFIPPTNLINYNGVVTPQGMNDLIKQVGDKVGSTVTEMWIFGGTTFINTVNKAFDGKVNQIPYNEQQSIKYGLKVQEFVNHATNMRVYLAPAPIMNLCGMHNEAFMLNLSDKYKCFQIGEKEPLEDRPKDGKSLSPEGQYSTLRELYNFKIYGVL